MSKEKEEILEEETELNTEQTDTADETETAEEKTEDLTQNLKEAEERYLRLAAEYDNYQKRTQREKAQRYDDAVIDTVKQIVPLIDDLDRALAVEVESEEAKKVLEGVSMVKRNFEKALAGMGVTPIEAVGSEFDPNYHDAVMHIEDESVADNIVVEEFMKGYMLKNRVVRHSMVKVAN